MNFIFLYHQISCCKCCAGVNSDHPWASIFMHASSVGKTDYVEAILAKDCDANIKDCLGFTPLMYASENGHLEIAKLLIKNKADVNVKDNDGNSAYDYAVLSKHDKIGTLLVVNTTT